MTAIKSPNGGATLEVSLSDATVVIEFEYSPGDPGNTSGPVERCYEPEPEELYITAVLINGEWIEAGDDVFAPKQIERWEQAVFQHMEDQRQSDLEDMAASRAAEREYAW